MRRHYLNMMTEPDIAEGCKRHDPEARKALYECFAGCMMSLCLRYTGNREEAEDLLHDGFLKAFNAIDMFTYRGAGSLGAWLRRIFTNQAISFLNARKHLVELTESMTENISDEDETEPPVLPASIVTELIGTLPPGYRAVLNLYLIEGWSHRDIARCLNIRESTSASQYLRARAALKKKIINYINTHDS